jgi:site-specific recombinase XerD
MDMTKVQDWLSTIPSKHTRKNYVAGIKKFETFYEKPVESLIGSEDAGRIIEKFYVWLKEKGHPQNTCRNLVNAPIQFLKYFNTPVKYRRNLGMYRTVATTRDHMITVSEVQEMAKVADLREQILLEVLLLGLRIGDVSTLEWRTFDVNGQPPIPIMIHTQKEDVIAQTFISEEFKGLLEKYLNTLDKSNKFLFQSNRKGNLSAKRIDQILKDLAERAGIKTHGLFRWHIGRKLFLRTCAELGVNAWNAKIMCGKSVSVDIATYINGVQLKNDFIKVSNVLRLFPKPVANGQTKQMLDVVFQVLRNLVEDKLKEQGLMKKARPINWQAIYEKLLPEEEKPEHVILT